MIKVIGKREEIAQAVKGISDKYPTALIEHLSVGEWFFILNGISVQVLVEESE